MILPTVTSADEAYKAAMKKSFPEKRHITDKHGLAALIIVLLYCGVIIIFALIIPESKVTGLKTADAMNETHTNRRSSDLSTKLIHDALSSAFISFHDDKLLIYLFVSKAIIGFCSLIPIGIVFLSLHYSLIRIMTLITSRVQDYRYHFIIISAGKMITTSIFLTVKYFCWTNRSTMCFALSEIIPLMINIILYFCYDDELKSRNESLKNTLRYYISHRYLILFQLLNYSVMLYLMAYVVTELYDLFPIYYLFPQLGIIFIIYLMHKYGEMVIIMSTASHGWKHGHETVSLKSILSSMIAIIRYHFGTIITNTPIVGYFADSLAHYSHSDCDSGDVIFKRFTSKCTMKRVIMFTAIHGQDILKGAKSAHYFEKKGYFVTDFENKTLAVWADVWMISLPTIFLLIYIKLSLSTAEDLLAETPNIMVYFAMLYTYLYVFCYTMNTVENTIEFCMKISNGNIKVMYEEEQFRLTKSLKQSVVTPYAVNCDEKRNNEVSKNEKKLEITINNNIA